MKPISCAHYRFPPEIIWHAIWLYLRITLSYRDVEDLLAERGLTVSNESIRRWVLKIGPLIAKNLRTIRPKAYTRWDVDERPFVEKDGLTRDSVMPVRRGETRDVVRRSWAIRSLQACQVSA
jgi:hypothetical protein